MYIDYNLYTGLSVIAKTEHKYLLPPTLVATVADELRHRILRGQYRPGEKLSEVTLAQELGVSRPPLREAMRLLQQEGLLASEPRKGMFLATLTPEDIRDIYTVRLALESLAVDLALPLNDPAQLQPLRDSIERMERDIQDGDLAELTLENSRFHRELVAISGNGYLQQVYGALMGKLQMCMAMNLRFRESLFGDREDVIRRHQVLVDLMETGEPEAVKYALANHGDRSFLSHLDILLQEPNPLRPDPSLTSA